MDALACGSGGSQVFPLSACDDFLPDDFQVSSRSLDLSVVSVFFMIECLFPLDYIILTFFC